MGPKVPIPDALVRISAPEVAGTVGAALDDPLVVEVRDEDGTPLEGIAVGWTVTTGGGLITPATSTTDAGGRASAVWTLGTVTGVQSATATVTELEPLTFTATATPGVPSSVTIVSGDEQSAAAGAVLGSPLVVRVADEYGNPVAAADVAWTVQSGGGTIDPPASATGADGQASTSWQLGPAYGAQTVLASAGAANVAFTATGLGPCDLAEPYQIGSVVSGELSSDDCLLPNGSWVDLYAIGLTAARAFQVDMAATQYLDTYLWIYDSAGNVVAFNDDAYEFGHTMSRIRILAASGEYEIGASSYFDHSVGGYGLSSAEMGFGVAGCAEVFATTGIILADSITAADCFDGSRRSDELVLYLLAGRAYTFTLESGAFDAFLRLVDYRTGMVAADDDDSAGGTDARLSFTPSTSGGYVLEMTTSAPDQTGPYTLTLE